MKCPECQTLLLEKIGLILPASYACPSCGHRFFPETAEKALVNLVQASPLDFVPDDAKPALIAFLKALDIVTDLPDDMVQDLATVAACYVHGAVGTEAERVDPEVLTQTLDWVHTRLIDQVLLFQFLSGMIKLTFEPDGTPKFVLTERGGRLGRTAVSDVFGPRPAEKVAEEIEYMGIEEASQTLLAYLHMETFGRHPQYREFLIRRIKQFVNKGSHAYEVLVDLEGEIDDPEG